MEHSFTNFSVGNLVVFEQSFALKDYEAFSLLSGDHNPLHHSTAYAKKSEFGKTIVPLHLMMAPMSRVAGMHFPGEPSLYLGHTVRAAKPLFYGETLRYSARIISLNSHHRALTIRVLGLRGSDVVLDAEMQVKSRMDSWQTAGLNEVISTSKPGRLLVTGATGEIGLAIARAFAEKGWTLLLQYRRSAKKITAFKRIFANQDVRFVNADLATKDGRKDLVKTITETDDLAAIVHAASPMIDAELENLVAVNYQALREIADAALPGMLVRQQGVVLFIGSTAMLARLPGWDDYASAKTMAAGWIGRFDKQQRLYGVRGKVLAPSYVMTSYSDAIRGDNDALLPQEVAEAALDMVENESAAMRIQKVGHLNDGEYGFHFPDAAGTVASPIQAGETGQMEINVAPDNVKDKVAAIVRRVLKISNNERLVGGGMGITAGWDSLAQIQVVLALESEFGFQLHSREIEAMSDFNVLVNICQEKMIS